MLPRWSTGGRKRSLDSVTLKGGVPPSQAVVKDRSPALSCCPLPSKSGTDSFLAASPPRVITASGLVLRPFITFGKSSSEPSTASTKLRPGPAKSLAASTKALSTLAVKGELA